MSRLINTHDQLKAAVAAGLDKRKAVAISYHSPDRSNVRDISVMKWSVWSPFFQANPDAAWYDHGCKTFGLGLSGTHKERKDAALKAAMDWAAKYGVIAWAKNRQGDYVAKEVNDKFPIPKERYREANVEVSR